MAYRRCKHCEKELHPTWNYCPICGSDYPRYDSNQTLYNRYWRKSGSKYRYFLVKDVLKYIDPIIALNGTTWTSNRIGEEESRIRHVRKQKTIREGTVDSWFTKLGIIHAFYELTPVKHDGSPLEIDPPSSKYYEE